MDATEIFKYNSLEDFLISKPLTVDGLCDDGWGAKIILKGREIEATILFADISEFSKRTSDLSPSETLHFVNHFMTWITAEAIRGKSCIIDKYIGDEVMLIFSKEFGSEDPFVEAVRTARWIGERDSLSFCPHMGIASGKVIIGYVGTPIKYNCSVFGLPVTVASRCANVQSTKRYSSRIVFPSNLWGQRVFNEIFNPVIYGDERKSVKVPSTWQMLDKRKENLKNLGEIEITEIVNGIVNIPSPSAEDWAREACKELQDKNK
jgi:hypothetical protein